MYAVFVPCRCGCGCGHTCANRYGPYFYDRGSFLGSIEDLAARGEPAEYLLRLAGRAALNTIKHKESPISILQRRAHMRQIHARTLEERATRAEKAYVKHGSIRKAAKALGWSPSYFHKILRTGKTRAAKLKRENIFLNLTKERLALELKLILTIQPDAKLEEVTGLKREEIEDVLGTVHSNL